MTRTGAFLRDFAENEGGAVTIDWVAITAGILLLGIAVVDSVFSGGVDPLTGQMNIALSTGGNLPDPGKGRFQMDGRLIMADANGKYTSHEDGFYKLSGSYYVEKSTGKLIAHQSDVDW